MKGSPRPVELRSAVCERAQLLKIRLARDSTIRTGGTGVHHGWKQCELLSSVRTSPTVSMFRSIECGRMNFSWSGEETNFLLPLRVRDRHAQGRRRFEPDMLRLRWPTGANATRFIGAAGGPKVGWLWLTAPTPANLHVSTKRKKHC